MAMRCLQSDLFCLSSLFLLLYAFVRFFLNFLAFLDNIFLYFSFLYFVPPIFVSVCLTIVSHCYIFSLTFPALKSLSSSRLSNSYVIALLNFSSLFWWIILFHNIWSWFIGVLLISMFSFIRNITGRWSLMKSILSSVEWCVISISLSAIVQSISV